MKKSCTSKSHSNTKIELQESEYKFHQTIKYLDEGYYSCMMDGVVLEHNQAFNRILGIDITKDLKGAKLPDFWLNPEERKVYLQELMTMGFIRNYIIDAKTAGGEKVVVMVNSHLVKDEQDKPVRIEGTFTDFTRLKLMEEALKESEVKYRTLFENVQVGMYRSKIDGSAFLDVNKKFAEIFGFEREEMLGTAGRIRWANPEDRDKMMKLLKEQHGILCNYECKVVDRKEKVINILASIELHAVEGYLDGTMVDITQRKLAEEQLRKLNRIYSLLSDINQAIVRTRDLKELFEKACNIAVEQGGFGMAWIGLIDESSQKLKVIAQAGRINGYHEQIDISLNGEPLNFCPIDSALRQRKHIVCNIIENEEMAPCQQIAYELGFRSSASFLLTVSDILKGAVTFYSDEPEFFDEEELKLLDELALDISFAMEYAEKEADRKRSEEELKISKERLLFATEGANLGIWNWNIVTGELIWSNQSKALFGIPLDETMSYQRFSDALHPDDRERTDRVVKDALDNHKDFDIEYRSLWPDESIHWIAAKGRGFYDSMGKAIRLEGVVLDITHSKLVGEALKTSEERFRTAAESLTDVVYDWDIKEKIDWYGDIDRIMGYPQGEFPRTMEGWAATIHPEDKDRVLEAVEGHLKALERYMVEYRVQRRDGEWRWWSARGTALRDYQGEPYKMIGSITDITERKVAEETLRESEAKYRTLVENIPQSIFMKDRNYKWVSINENFARSLGVSPDDVVGKVDHDLFPGDIAEKYHADDLRIMEKGQTEEFEEKSILDGKLVWVNTIKTPVRDKNGEIVGVLGIFWDITERKLAVEEIRKLNAELEERVAIRTSQLEASYKELEAFSYSVSHDLRAPLRHVSGYVELLNKRFQSDLPEKGRHYLNSIADSVHLMGVLIDDLLQFSRTGRIEMLQSDIAMNEVVYEAIKSLCIDNPDRKIEWIQGELPSVYGDEAMLRLVWTNLLSNAVKFTRTRRKAMIEIGVREENKESVFFVRDNGVGFDMQYAQKLFGVFQRLHPTEEFEGTGIGLANVHRIVVRHGGRTWAEAELDKGAVFYFSIPKK